MTTTARESAPSVGRVHAPVRPALIVALIAAVVAVVVGTVVVRAGVIDLLDAGAVVRWGAPVATTLAELAAAVTIGALTLAAFVLPVAGSHGRGRGSGSDGVAWTAVLRVAAVFAGVWTLLALADLVLGYGVVAGRPLDTPTFGSELGVYVTSISLGKIGLGVVVVAALTSVVSVLVTSPTGALWTWLLAVVALVLVAQTGHASGDTNHELALSTMFAHLLGAAVWIGGLAALALVAAKVGRDLDRVVARYSAIALWSYLAVAVSGAVNAAIRMDGLKDLATPYGQLVAAKILLTVALGAIGWAHRRLVVGRLSGSGGATAGRWRDVPRVFWRLVAVELVIMGVVSGVAVALASGEPPVPQAPTGELTPAEIVTGHLLPAAPTTEAWFTTFRWDLLMAGVATAGIVVYLRWVVRLAARGDRWPPGRSVTWVIGMVLFFWATSGGPAVYGHVLLSAHMIEHMVLMLVIPVFLVVSGPVTLALRALPMRTDGTRGPREWLLALVHSRWARLFANPVVAAANFALSMYVFYFTELFRLSLETYVGHLAMIVHFSLVGYMFLNGLIGIDPGPNRPPHPIRLIILFAAMAVHAFFGVALTMDTALLVPEWYGLLGRTWGPSALVDQQEAGAIVWGISEVPLLIVAIVLAASWSRADERAVKRRDRAADRDGDAELAAYNAMLKEMSDRDR